MGNDKQHEPCPVCGAGMEVMQGRREIYLVCQHGCGVIFNPERLIAGHDGLWDAWDTGVSEQRGKWVEEHVCLDCVGFMG